MDFDTSFTAQADTGETFTVMVKHEQAGRMPMIGGASMSIGGGDKFYVDHDGHQHQLGRLSKGVYKLTCGTLQMILRSDEDAAT